MVVEEGSNVININNFNSRNNISEHSKNDDKDADRSVWSISDNNLKLFLAVSRSILQPQPGSYVHKQLLYQQSETNDLSCQNIKKDQ